MAQHGMGGSVVYGVLCDRYAVVGMVQMGAIYRGAV